MLIGSGTEVMLESVLKNVPALSEVNTTRSVSEYDGTPGPPPVTLPENGLVVNGPKVPINPAWPKSVFELSNHAVAVVEPDPPVMFPEYWNRKLGAAVVKPVSLINIVKVLGAVLELDDDEISRNGIVGAPPFPISTLPLQLPIVTNAMIVFAVPGARSPAPPSVIVTSGLTPSLSVIVKVAKAELDRPTASAARIKTFFICYSPPRLPSVPASDLLQSGNQRDSAAFAPLFTSR